MQRSIRSRLIQERLASIRDRITAISPERQVRLVAVSKKMPVEDIQSAYDYGHRDFGENYVNELTEKSSKLPSDIQWRFIGHLQSNKVQNVLSVKNLRAIETLDSPKLARLLNKHWDNRDYPLDVFIQINTSNETGKNGVKPSDCLELAKIIKEECGKLRLCGLMTIGMADRDQQEENPDFKCLLECRRVLAEAGFADLELSMGMSEDYEQAVQMGSTNVRVGSLIFGPRQ